MIRSATAIWKGGPGAGEGSVSTSSGVISNALYAFGSASGNEPCTSPSEMLAAAVASCTSLMLAQEIAKAGLRPEKIKTESTITLEETKGRWEITGLLLEISTNLPESKRDIFEKAVKKAHARCPISHALKVKTRLTATLEHTADHAVVA